MKIQSKYRGIKGFLTVYDRAVRYRYMITETAKRRQKILIHWEKHGLSSTTDAFGVLKRTLHNWKRALKEGGGKVEALNPKSRRPKAVRKRAWDFRILEEIKKLRVDHPNLGADKLHPLLLDFCDALGIKCPGSTTIERLIADLGGLRACPQKVTGTGRVAEKVWLKATELGLSVHPCTGVIYFTERINGGDADVFSENHLEIIKSAYADITRTFGVEGKTIPMLFRIGYADDPSARSLRMKPNILFAGGVK